MSFTVFVPAFRRVALVLAAALPVLAYPAISLAAPRSSGDPGSPTSMRPGSCGTPTSSVDLRSEAERAAAISNVIFMNRCIGGCLITKVADGQTDARLNWSETPVNGDVGLPQFDIEPDDWTALMACVQDGFAPYDIVVTDVDPMDASHHEAIVAGKPQDIGMPDDILGVSRLSSTCEPFDNSISFSFAEHPGHETVDGPRVIELCTTIVHEVGHAYGMEHAHFCSDVMTYIADSCGERKYFRDELMVCGEGFGTNDPDPSDDTRPCTCSGSLQNTHAKMALVFDPNPEPLPTPEVAINTPAADETVSDGFLIFATADGALRGLGRYEVLINGYIWVTEEIHDYGDASVLIEVAAPASLPDGYLDIEVRAYNDLRTEFGVAEVTALKGSPCTNEDSCATGQLCEEGRCFWEAPTLDFGEDCEFPQACLSGICEGTCTTTCQVGVADACPSGFECEAPAGASSGLCAAPAEGGCCSTADATGAGMATRIGLGLFVIGVLLRPRRRRGAATA